MSLNHHHLKTTRQASLLETRIPEKAEATRAATKAKAEEMAMRGNRIADLFCTRR
jgi:hypothetical protein